MRQELEIPPTHESVGDALVGTRSVLNFLDVDSPRTLSGLVASGVFPPADTKLGRENRWFASTLRGFLISLKDEAIGKNGGRNGSPPG